MVESGEKNITINNKPTPDVHENREKHQHVQERCGIFF